jgi:hypothetical protein
MVAVGLGLLGFPSGAAADLTTLKAHCTQKDAADNNTADGLELPYKFCDDGVPPAGGRTPNVGALNAVAVPERYGGDGFSGLPPKALPADPNSGADANGDIALDVDVSLPDPSINPVPPGGYPLMVMMHGCCGGNKTGWEADTVDAGGEKWHYSNAWFASRGYVVLTYTARGFVDGQNHGSTGEAQLDSRRYEINDYQHLAGLLADDPFFKVNGQNVVTTGGSYGGGFSWLALTDPTWTSPGGKPMQLAATAPKYGWTDLVYSLLPNGTHLRDGLPAPDGSSTITPFGFPKRSINAGLYASGKTGLPPDFTHTTFPMSVDVAQACLSSSDPYDQNPLCTQVSPKTIPDTLGEFLFDRSAYYQNAFFARIASDPSARVPVFSAGTFTDPLFTNVEHRRMVRRLKSIVPNYPVQEYYGDYQHFTQNKDKEWGDMCGADHHVCRYSDYPGGNLNATPNGLVQTGVTTRLDRFVDHYAVPPGDPNQPTPAFDVTASLQVCPQNASTGSPVDEPGARFEAPTFGALAPNHLIIAATGGQTTTSTAADPHASSSDPVANQVANGKQCPVDHAMGGAPTAGQGVATYDSKPLPHGYTMIGRTRVSVAHTGSGSDVQLNARLYDLFPDGTQVMVDRGVRVLANINETTIYDLDGQGWRFPQGHRIRIELTQDDDPYIKRSAQPSSLTLSGVTLDIPVREASVTLEGAVPPRAGYGAAGACQNRIAPRTQLRRRGVHATQRLLVVKGRSRGHGCRRVGRAGRVAAVYVSVVELGRHGCRFLKPNGKLSRKHSRCRSPALLRARGTTRWRLKQRVRLPRGRYRFVARARDTDGNTERTRKRNSVTVRVR